MLALSVDAPAQASADPELFFATVITLMGTARTARAKGLAWLTLSALAAAILTKARRLHTTAIFLILISLI